MITNPYDPRNPGEPPRITNPIIPPGPRQGPIEDTSPPPITIMPPITRPGEPGKLPGDTPPITKPVEPKDPIIDYTPPPPTPPSVEEEKSTYISPTGIKQATPDIIIFDEDVDPDFLVQAFFEEFGGTELIKISRHDLIDGQDVSYSPIVNLSSLRQSFNPNNIIAIGAFQETPTRYGIDLLSRGVVEPVFDDNGNLVIEIEFVLDHESIEVENAIDGTISRIEL